MPYCRGSSYWVGSKKPIIPQDFELDDRGVAGLELLDRELIAGRGVWLYGPPGTGKTTLLAHFADGFLRKPLPSTTWRTRAPWLDREAIWSTMAEYVEDVKSEINMSRRPDFTDFGDAFSASGIARSTPLLFLDDLGAEHDSEYSRSTVESLIDSRYRCRDEQITWFTSNLDLTDLSRRYSQRTVSRLCEMCALLAYDGDDRRIARAMSQGA